MIKCCDCIKGMQDIDENSIDAVITDGPYGIGFMGKEFDTFKDSGGAGTDWKSDERFVCLDGSTRRKNWLRASKAGSYDFSLKGNQVFQLWTTSWGVEALRVLKPGGYLLSFGGTRTYHRMVCGLEDAGFEIRDCVMWIYGSGFPKSLNIGKAIDKKFGVDREVIDSKPILSGGAYQNGEGKKMKEDSSSYFTESNATITSPSTPEAIQWDGWGTALKPAYEPIVVCRKPIKGTVVDNVLKWGTGGINVDGCRIKYEKREDGTQIVPSDSWYSEKGGSQKFDGASENQNSLYNPKKAGEQWKDNPIGRFPANVIFDEASARVLDEQSGNIKSGAMNGKYGHKEGFVSGTIYQNTKASEGGASRFFYTAKAHSSERNMGCDGLTSKNIAIQQPHNSKSLDERYDMKSKNSHPTVKPLDLMRYLIKMVCHKGSVVLDPFAGSGTTLIACKQLGIDCVGFEKEHEYCDIANKRLHSVTTVDKWLI